MTLEKAIEIIRLAQSQIEWEYPMDYAVAFDMAISALQAQDVHDTNVGDAISRQATLDLAMQYCPDDDRSYSKADRDIRELLDDLENLPSAQPKRKTGKWIKCDTDGFRNMCKCSECGARIDIQEEFRSFFCYHCGANMKGETRIDSKACEVN